MSTDKEGMVNGSSSISRVSSNFALARTAPLVHCTPCRRFYFLCSLHPWTPCRRRRAQVRDSPMLCTLTCTASQGAALTSILEMLEKVSVQLMAKLDYCMLPGLPGGQTPNPAARGMELQAATAGLMASVVQVQEAAAGAV